MLQEKCLKEKKVYEHILGGHRGLEFGEQDETGHLM